MEQAWDILAARPPHPLVLEILYQGGIYRCVVAGRVQHDNALVTAMIERWRPETHTFHLYTGETTITLQDVEVLYGLQVDGRALVIQKPQQMSSYRQELNRLTGFGPQESHIWGQSRLLMHPLFDHLRLVDMQHPITEDIPQVDVDRRARLYLLVIFGGILFPNTSGSHVNLRYLPFLEHLGELGCYSWGAAVLAFMHRRFRRAFMGARTDVAAFCPLLQIWVWTRMRPLQPIAADPLLDYIDEAMPYARR
ncbi:protein MAIN-LIKE 2-like [Lycium ferocissimum]|uniref:protein MAIN-LIKE 2-like n=1 Tax=Lycium ferocissimum TaxID=112874 RepID=UPI002815616D|nr:protein MAIN-LIKE 2-like [Lycium ferocissimum]